MFFSTLVLPPLQLPQRMKKLKTIKSDKKKKGKKSSTKTSHSSKTRKTVSTKRKSRGKLKRAKNSKKRELHEKFIPTDYREIMFPWTPRPCKHFIENVCYLIFQTYSSIQDLALVRNSTMNYSVSSTGWSLISQKLISDRLDLFYRNFIRRRVRSQFFVRI